MWGGNDFILFENLIDFLLFLVSCWFSVRFNLLSAVIVGVIGLLCLITSSISASAAAFALIFTKALIPM
jgi:uncharacterized MnhB-related membrane protein